MTKGKKRLVFLLLLPLVPAFCLGPLLQLRLVDLVPVRARPLPLGGDKLAGYPAVIRPVPGGVDPQAVGHQAGRAFLRLQKDK